MKKLMKRFLSVFIISALCLSIVLVGCNTQNKNQIKNNTNDKENNKITENKENTEKTDEQTQNTETKQENQLKEINSSEYNLGKGVIKQSSNIDMPYDMVGAIAAPKEGENYPIVVILHGSHKIKDYNKDRYDLGFKYLVEALAKKGYLALSLNINAQHVLEYGEPRENERLETIYNDHLSRLKAAINGEEDKFGIDLKNKGDLSKVVLIGHSRGGGTLDAIVNAQVAKQNGDIVGLIKVAPARYIVIENDNPDIPTGIIIPQYDGDVTGLDGQTTFDELKEDSERKSWTSLVFLKEGGHNLFNDNVVEDDRLNYGDEAKDNFITRDQQKQFLVDYSTDFLSKLFGKKVSSFLFDIEKPTESKAYGLNVKSSFVSGNEQEILKATGADKLSKNDLGGKNVAEGLNAEYMIESTFFKEDQLPNFDHPGNTDKYGLIKLSYTKNGAQYKIEIPEAKKDISGYKALSLFMALYPGSDLNEPNENQALTVMVKDKSGKEAKVILDENTSAISWPEGKSMTNEYATYWSLKTPISEARIPLSELKDVDLSNIESISLVFDQKERGCILMRDILLMK